MKINCNKLQLNQVISNYPDDFLFDFELGEISKDTLINIVKARLNVKNLFCYITAPKTILTELVDKSLPKSYIENYTSPGGSFVEEQRRLYKDYLFFQDFSESEIIFIVNCKDFNSKNASGILSSEDMYKFFDYFCEPVNYINLYSNIE